MKVPPCNIHIDAEGAWYHEGNEITRREIIEHFMEHLRRTEGGSYTIEIGTNVCELEVEDTPFVISRVERVKPEGSEAEQILLSLRNLSRAEVLNPDTLCVGKDHVLYCSIWGGAFSARFSRPAYYQLAEWVMEDPGTGRFYIELNGEQHVIA